MSKELDALKDLSTSAMCCGAMEMSVVEKNHTIIKQALKEYEQYKAIEQELGITLDTYFKALNNGAWYKDISGNICWCDIPKFSKGDIDFNGYHTTTRMYGVIWALTREELE